ncbi:T9SS type A sorting domain-containing protein [Adhaeribacter sp. BT258]|uniref:T9SS type A sorting domain-containing protein n=1 Tax=Adhaeribacter terrigena TaxID=2793070 RepID=A0ABS1C4P8_9BACT|nr:T9SS type A sorting domain-containing protein [Adhaeribacter terrigena]MBK0404368.1 T9SS type A sorting domain-containing protein [Adhaeribacter terrigena]
MKQILQLNLKNPVKWGLAIAGILCLGLSQANAQAGYQYQSRTNGAWSDYRTWQRWQGTGNITIEQLQPGDPVPDHTASSISIKTGHIVNVDNTTTTADELTVEAGGTLVIDYNQKLTIHNGTSPGHDMTVYGTVISKGRSANATENIGRNNAATILFAGSAVYKHNPDVKIGVVPTATWDAASTVEFIYSGTTIGGVVAPANGFNQTFGHVKWNTPSITSNIDLGGQLTTVRGNFEVLSTGFNAANNPNSLILGTSGTHTLTVDRNMIISNSSDVVFSTQGAPATGTLVLNLGGNLTVATTAKLRNNTLGSPLKVNFKGNGTLSTPTLTNMNFEVTPAATITLANNFAIATGQNFNVFGRLNTGLNAINGGGNFTLENGGILGIGLAAGISTSGGNIQNTGSRTFSTSANYVYDRQNFAQNTGDLLPATVAGLTVNNPLGLTLTNPVAVTRNLTLTKGLLRTGTNALTLSSGIAISSAENSSYVEGPVAYEIATNGLHNITFPLGSNSLYRPVSLSFNQSTATPTVYTATLMGGQPASRTIPEEITHVSKLRYYNISKGTGSAITNGYVTFTFAADDMVTDPTKLALAKSDGTDWKFLGGTVNGQTIQSTIPFDSFSDFALANAKNGLNPLPVALVSFKAEKTNQAVNLNWETASEKNNDFFAVERSADGRNFETIGQVKGTGNSNALIAYAFADKNPVTGVSYYRLKQTDFDGKFEYSKIVSVTFEGKLNSIAITAFPNPANNVLNVKVANLTEKATLEITDVTGRSLKQVQINAAETNALNVAMLPKGLYQIRVISENGTTVSKFLKQ